jgi:preprotein translocase subunit SecG
MEGALIVALRVLQMIVAILLIAAILLQARTQELGGVFGGAQATVFRTRRGLEKTLFQGTIGLAVLFIALSILSALAGRM